MEFGRGVELEAKLASSVHFKHSTQHIHDLECHKLAKFTTTKFPTMALKVLAQKVRLQHYKNADLIVPINLLDDLLNHIMASMVSWQIQEQYLTIGVQISHQQYQSIHGKFSTKLQVQQVLYIQQFQTLASCNSL